MVGMDTQMDVDAQPRVPLSRDRVLRAAVVLADEVGADALSMRKLAQELGVVPMALYKHVASKDELLDGMVDVVVGEIDPPPGGTDWKTAIRQRVLSARRALLRHPWASRVIESRAAATPTVLEYMDSMIGIFRAGGFSIDLTHHAMHAMGSRLLGFSQELFDDTADLGADQAAAMLAQLAGRYPSIVELVIGSGELEPVAGERAACAPVDLGDPAAGHGVHLLSLGGDDVHAEVHPSRTAWSSPCVGEPAGRLDRHRLQPDGHRWARRRPGSSPEPEPVGRRLVDPTGRRQAAGALELHHGRSGAAAEHPVDAAAQPDAGPHQCLLEGDHPGAAFVVTGVSGRGAAPRRPTAGRATAGRSSSEAHRSDRGGVDHATGRDVMGALEQHRARSASPSRTHRRRRRGGGSRSA